MSNTEAEIEIVEALWKHAKTLRHNKDPYLSIAAAQREILLARELDTLRNRESSDQPEAALAGAGK